MRVGATSVQAGTSHAGTGWTSRLVSGALANEWTLAALIFITTRLFALAGGYIGATRLIRAQPSYSKGWLAEMALMWDAAHYVTVAQNGYTYSAQATGGSDVAFPPLYPFLLDAVSHLLRWLTFGWDWGNGPYGSLVAAGLLISNVSFFVALAFLVHWLRPRLGMAGAGLVAFGVAALPTAFFFSALYTESLFLLLVLAAFLLAHSGLRHRWLLVGLVGMLACLTRFTGVLLLPVLAVDYLAQVGWKLRRVRPDALWLGLIPAGVGLYIGFLWWRFGDPGAVSESMLKGWNHQASFFVQTYLNSLAQLWNSLTGSVLTAQDPVLYYGQGSRLYAMLDLALPPLLLVGGWLGRKKLLPAEWLWLGLGVVYPLSANITFSMARYVLPLWPGLIWLGTVRGKARIFVVALIAASLLLMLWCSEKYAGAHWIG